MRLKHIALPVLIAVLIAGCDDNKPTLREDPVAAAAAAYPEGEKIYNQYCISCHQGGISGARRFGDTEAWKQGLQEHTLDGLVATAIAGKDAMPARGLCTQCSDEQVKEATLYMIRGSGITPP